MWELQKQQWDLSKLIPLDDMRHLALTRIDDLGNKLVDALSIPQNAGVVVAFSPPVQLKNRVAGV